MAGVALRNVRRFIFPFERNVRFPTLTVADVPAIRNKKPRLVTGA